MARERFLAILAAGASLIAVPAWAEDAPQPDEGTIVVTAGRREQRVIDVPSAVSAIPAELLKGRAISQIEDYAALAPGFSVQKEGRTGIRLVLRGQNAGGSGATVATVIDDVVLNSATANGNGSTVTPNLETYDLERVEVLRGPQGTLYGATAQGGLLKYVTRKPELGRFGLSAEAGLESVLGADTGWNVKGAVNVPLLGDKAAFRVMGFYNDVPGWIDNPLLGLRNVNGGKRYGYRASFLLKPVEPLTIRLTASKQREKYGSEGLADINGAPLTPNRETPSSYRLPGDQFTVNRRTTGGVIQSFEHYQAAIDYDFGPVTLSSSTGFAKGKRSLGFDVSDQPVFPGATLAGFLGPALFFQPIVAVLDQTNQHEKFSQEVRLASAKGGRLFWQGGVFYSHEDVRVDRNIRTVSAANTNLAVTVPAFIPGIGGLGLGATRLPSKYDEISGFGDVTFKFTPRLELSVGGRITHVEQSQRAEKDAGLFNLPFDLVYPRLRLNEDKFTFSVAPRYQLTDDVSVYFRAASGFRPGGFVEPVPGGPATLPTLFRQDNTVNYEIGAKGGLFGNRLSFDLAVFQVDWDDIQVLTTVPGPGGQLFTVVGNAGDARSRGVEWNLALRPYRGVSLAWTGGYTDAALTSVAAALGGAKGDALPFVPDVTSSLSADYSYGVARGATLNLGASWTHVGDRFGSFSTSFAISNHPPIPAYDTLDLRAGLDWKAYRLQLVARNVTDSRGLIDYRSAAGYNGLLGQGNFIQPRTLLFTVSTSF